MTKAKLAVMGVLAIALVGLAIPVRLFPESALPSNWYHNEWSTLWFLFAAVVYYPATVVATTFGQQVGGAFHWVACFAWLAFLCYIIWRLPTGRLAAALRSMPNHRMEADAPPRSEGDSRETELGWMIAVWAVTRAVHPMTVRREHSGRQGNMNTSLIYSGLIIRPSAKPRRAAGTASARSLLTSLSLIAGITCSIRGHRQMGDFDQGDRTERSDVWA